MTATDNRGAIIIRGEIQRDRIAQKVRNARAVSALSVPVPVEELVQIANRLDDLTSILRGDYPRIGAPPSTEKPVA